MSLQIYLRWDVLSWSSNQQNADPSSRVHWMLFFFHSTGDSLVDIRFSPQIVPPLSGSPLKSFQNLLPLSLPCAPTRNVQKNTERQHSIFAALILSLVYTQKRCSVLYSKSTKKKCFLIRSQTTQSKHSLTNFQLSNLFDLLLCLREFFIFGGQFQLDESFSLLSQHLLCMLPVTVWTHTFLEACLRGYHKLHSLSWFDFTVTSR